MKYFQKYAISLLITLLLTLLCVSCSDVNELCDLAVTTDSVCDIYRLPEGNEVIAGTTSTAPAKLANGVKNIVTVLNTQGTTEAEGFVSVSLPKEKDILMAVSGTDNLNISMVEGAKLLNSYDNVACGKAMRHYRITKDESSDFTVRLTSPSMDAMIYIIVAPMKEVGGNCLDLADK